jgi:uncharacterized membrane protein
MKSKSLVLLSVLSLLPCVCYGQWPYENRDRGLALGALMGGVTGGVVGHQSGKTAPGALIGGAVGALAGAAIGDSVDTKIAQNNAAWEQRLIAQQQSQAVTVQDVIAMSQARLSDSVIATHIQTHGVVARLQPSELITLRNAGVSDAVISTMQTAPLAVAAVAPPTAYRHVIVREHYYAPPVVVAPVYPVHPGWHHGPGWPHPPPVYRYSPGVHWGVTIGH